MVNCAGLIYVAPAFAGCVDGIGLGLCAVAVCNVSMHQFTPLKKKEKLFPCILFCGVTYYMKETVSHAPLLYSHKARQDKASPVFLRLHGNQFFALAKYRTVRALVASGIEGCKIAHQSNIEQLCFGGISNISHADHFQLLSTLITLLSMFYISNPLRATVSNEKPLTYIIICKESIPIS